MCVPTFRSRLVSLLLVSVSLLGLPLQAGAWGAKGHRIVGLVASGLLTPTAKASITQIMGNADLATMAVYLDVHKNELDQRIPHSRDWHYDDVPVCGSASHAEYCPHDDCASTQADKYSKVLIDSHSSKQDKQFAIFVLTHVIGDIHQPLHTADNNDRGGNGINIRLPNSTKKLNLHSAWDTDFVEGQFQGQNEVTLAKALVQKFAADAKTENWTTGTIATWIAESHKIAHDMAYAQVPGFACGTALGPQRIALPPEYVNAATVIVERQLAKAGYRLAEVLNQAFPD